MWTLGRSYDKKILRYGEEQTGKVEDYNEWNEYGEANPEDIWRWDWGEKNKRKTQLEQDGQFKRSYYAPYLNFVYHCNTFFNLY